MLLGCVPKAFREPFFAAFLLYNIRVIVSFSIGSGLARPIHVLNHYSIQSYFSFYLRALVQIFLQRLNNCRVNAFTSVIYFAFQSLEICFSLIFVRISSRQLDYRVFFWPKRRTLAFVFLYKGRAISRFYLVFGGGIFVAGSLRVKSRFRSGKLNIIWSCSLKLVLSAIHCVSWKQLNLKVRLASNAAACFHLFIGGRVDDLFKVIIAVLDAVVSSWVEDPSDNRPVVVVVREVHLKK